MLRPAHVLLLLAQASTADKVDGDGDEEAVNKMEEGCGELLQHDFQNGTWHFFLHSS